MKTKRFLAGVMSLALMGTLAGCGNSEVQAPTDVSVTTAPNAGGDTADAGNTDDGGDSAGTGDSEGSETAAAAEERDLKAEFAALRRRAYNSERFQYACKLQRYSGWLVRRGNEKRVQR